MYVGWYSETMAEISGTVWWETPDGEQVELTHITPGNKQGLIWQDIRRVGLVESYICQGRSHPSADNIAILR